MRIPYSVAKSFLKGDQSATAAVYHSLRYAVYFIASAFALDQQSCELAYRRAFDASLLQLSSLKAHSLAASICASSARWPGEAPSSFPYGEHWISSFFPYDIPLLSAAVLGLRLGFGFTYHEMETILGFPAFTLRRAYVSGKKALPHGTSAKQFRRELVAALRGVTPSIETLEALPCAKKRSWVKPVAISGVVLCLLLPVPFLGYRIIHSELVSRGGFSSCLWSYPNHEAMSKSFSRLVQLRSNYECRLFPIPLDSLADDPSYASSYEIYGMRYRNSNSYDYNEADIGMADHAGLLIPKQALRHLCFSLTSSGGESKTFTFSFSYMRQIADFGRTLDLEWADLSRFAYLSGDSCPEEQRLINTDPTNSFGMFDRFLPGGMIHGYLIDHVSKQLLFDFVYDDNPFYSDSTCQAEYSAKLEWAKNKATFETEQVCRGAENG